MKSFLRLTRRVFSYLTSPAGFLRFAAVLLISGGAAALFLEFRAIKMRADEAFEKSRASLTSNEIVFKTHPLTAVNPAAIKIIQSAADVRALAEFDNSVFAATSGGLVRLTADGLELRRYSVTDGLPESDLTSLAVFRDRLYIGTSASGIVVFDGAGFHRLVLEDHPIKAVTALFADDRSLLAGTSGGGLLEFDGATLTEVKAADNSLKHVVFAERRDGELIAATFADGLWLSRGGRWRNFTKADGLPSNRVVAANSVGSVLYVLTDLGLARGTTDDGAKFTLVAAIQAAAGMVLDNGKLRIVRDDGTLFSVDPKASNPRPEPSGGVSKCEFTGARFAALKDEIFVVGSRGVFRLSEDYTARRFFEPVREALTENTIAALAFDDRGSLWCGNFRRGIDVVSAGGEPLRRLAAEQFQDVNTIANAGADGMLVASNRGATRVGDDFGPVGATASALPSRAVTAAITMGDTKVFATSRGLAIDDGDGIRVLTTVNGLPSNSVTSLIAARGAIYAGTTGGLAEVRDGRIVRAFHTSDSGLGHGWVTALDATGNRVFIGTFGGGVFELRASGEIVEVGDARFAVNPNALACDGETIYAGTPDGVRIFGPADENWRRVTSGLPSPNVLAIAVRDGRVVFGTTSGIAVAGRDFGT